MLTSPSAQPIAHKDAASFPPLLDARPPAPLDRQRRIHTVTLMPNGTFYDGVYHTPAVAAFETHCCAFAQGTQISTPHGPVSIEDLIPGDMVSIQNGQAAPVIWIGSTFYEPNKRDQRDPENGLIRVLAPRDSKAAAFGDLLLGPAARLVQSSAFLNTEFGAPEVLTPCSDFADGQRAVQIAPPGPIRLFHFRTPKHSIVTANGWKTETFHPGRGLHDQMDRASLSLFLAQFPDIDSLEGFGPLCIPRISQATLDSLTPR